MNLFTYYILCNEKKNRLQEIKYQLYNIFNLYLNICTKIIILIFLQIKHSFVFS